jgi:ABC-type nitrate/sulfonate/bicarbonate transport system substrate-binding protein
VPQTKLRVAVPEHAGPVHWTGLIAAAEGLYADEGLDVEQLRMDHDEQAAHLLAGDTPIERRGPDGDIVLIEAGHPVRIIAGLVRKPPLYVYGAHGVGSLADLRGTTLAAVSGKFGSSLALRMVLADAGLNAGDYTLRMVGGTARRYDALVGGSVSATILTPPQSGAAARAGLPLLASLPERYPNFLFSAMQVNLTYAHAHPDVIVAFLRAEIRAQRRLADPAAKEAMIRVLVERSELDRPESEACYAEMVERDRVFCTDGMLVPSDLGDLVDGLRRLGECDCRLGPAAYLDLTWLNEAQRQVAADGQAHK